MQFAKWWLASFVLAMTFSAQVSIAQSDPNVHIESSEITELFRRLDRRASWKLIKRQPLAFDTYHPQGLTRVGELFYLSTVQKPTRTDNAANGSAANPQATAGQGFLITYDDSGQEVRRSGVGEGSLYHPGGIDRDEQYIWVPVAEYRPDSSTIIYRVEINSLKAETLFRISDHIGAVVRDPIENRLIGFSWGSRRIYAWQLDDSHQLHSAQRTAPSQTSEHSLQESSVTAGNDYQLLSQHYIDYQDCQTVGNRLAICSGLANYRQPGGGKYSLGGIELFDLATLKPVHQIPVDIFTEGPAARVITQNPCYVESVAGALRFHFVPEDNVSHHLIYEVRPR
ncbi:MAG: hypothetical protein KF752_02265 [Pirellulaceae bacterium]|nr:hypothetical protein [Pirellulaceae bacterium]